MAEFICRIYNRNTSFSCCPEETLLASSMKAGVNLPYHCATGYCGACKVKLRFGKIKMDHSGGISRADQDNGFILPCCTAPSGDIEIETNE